MDDIAKQLGMSKKTLYKYFSNKKELVFEITKNQIDSTEALCNSQFINAKDAIHELFMVMEMLKMIFHNINPSLIFDLKKYHTKAWGLMEEHQDGFIHDMLYRVLQKGVDEKLFRNNLNIKILTKLRLEEIKASFNSEIFSAAEYNMEEVQIVMLEHFILGITTLEGHKLALEYQKEVK